MTSIFGVLNNNNVAPDLFQGLQRLQLEYGEYDGISIATLMEGRIQHQHIAQKWLNLVSSLQKSSIEGHLGIVCTRRTGNDNANQFQTYLCVNKHVALAHYGIIQNHQEIREDLRDLGYDVRYATDGEILLHLIHRYLDLGISPIEATFIVFARLKGKFAILMLFADQQDWLIAGRRGCSLAVGADDNKIYVGSDTQALSLLSKQVVQIAEGTPVILRSVNMASLTSSGWNTPSYPPYFDYSQFLGI